MKVNNLFLVGVAALSLGMTACNNEDVPPVNNPGEGTTFAGMYVSAMKDVSTRAVNDNQEDYGGRTEESKLTELQLLSNVLSQTWTLGTVADETGKFLGNANSRYIQGRSMENESRPSIHGLVI